jgi:MFS family permease
LASTKEKATKVPFILSQIANLFSVAAGSAVFMAFPWLAIELTGSATSAGLLVTITSIPGLLLAPVMGSIVDKFGRRKTIIWIEAACALVAALIPFVAGIWVMTLTILIALGTARSAVAAGATTARKAFVPDVAQIGKLSLERANSIHEAVFQSGFAIGPAVAAVCISWLGPYNTFYVVALFSLLAGLLMLPIKAKEHYEEHEDDHSMFRFAFEGFYVLFKTPSVLMLMLGIMTFALIYLPTEMVVLPKFYNLISEPQQLGFLLSIMAGFTVIGSLLFERLSKKFKYTTIFRITLLGVAGCMVPMSFLLDYGWMIFFGALLGLAWGPLPPLLNTVIQRKVAPSKRGRVFSLEMAIWSGGPMMSMIPVGLAVDGLGVSITYKILALLVVVAALFVTLSRHMKEINTADFQA